jgi:DNA-directed RNA polymerase subunit RPC12/RpoP
MIGYQVENKLAARHVVEEAMTQAFVRKCNKCSRVFLKADGCNKITCDCGNKQCYVCGMDVANYGHFDQSRNPTKCPLYGEMHELLHHQVAVAQEKTVQDLLRNRAELQEDDIRVDKGTVADASTLNFPYLLQQNTAPPVPDVTLFQYPLRHEMRRLYHRAEYTCPECSKNFFSEKALSQHQAAKHPVVCKECGRRLPSADSLDEHMTDTHGHVCEVCEKRFGSAASLEQHTKDKHPVKCEECGKGFHSAESLDEHMRDKHGHVCEKCGKRFGSPDSLDHHKRDKHPKACKECGKRFGSVDSLDLHMADRHGHVCEVCESRFGSVESLGQHTRAKHPPECEECGKKFGSAEYLDQHKRDKHEHHCHECGDKFGSADLLDRHVKDNVMSWHGDAMPQWKA